MLILKMRFLNEALIVKQIFQFSVVNRERKKCQDLVLKNENKKFACILLYIGVYCF